MTASVENKAFDLTAGGHPVLADGQSDQAATRSTHLFKQRFVKEPCDLKWMS